MSWEEEDYEQNLILLKEVRTLPIKELAIKRGMYRSITPAVIEFLKDNPELGSGPHPNDRSSWDDQGRVYPSIEGWLRFCRIMTAGDLWGNEAIMTQVAHLALGAEVAVCFPKFLLCYWPKTEAYRKLLLEARNIPLKNQFKPFLTPMQEVSRGQDA
jgi:hypothetical protein